MYWSDGSAVMTSLDEIRYNAQNGLGPCEGCPAQEATEGKIR